MHNKREAHITPEKTNHHNIL